MKHNNFQSALEAAVRSAEIDEASDVYGWLIGSWNLDVRRIDAAGQERRGSGEVHFAWVLQGRAMEDVWIMENTYGMTLRVWHPSSQTWRVVWINPVSGARNELAGRRIGKDIVQVGTHGDGTPIRWIFTDITPDSFRWVGEVLERDGNTWRLEAEFLANRATSRPSRPTS